MIFTCKRLNSYEVMRLPIKRNLIHLLFILIAQQTISCKSRDDRGALSSTDPSLLSKCGAQSAHQIIMRSREILTSFSAITSFNKAFAFSDVDLDTQKEYLEDQRSENSKALKIREELASVHKWAGKVYAIYEKLLDHKQLKPLRRSGLGRLYLKTDGSKIMPVTNTSDLYVEFDPKLAEKMIGLPNGEEVVQATLAHEIGHIVVDGELHHNASMALKREFSDSSKNIMYRYYPNPSFELTYLHYHLLVDGVGALLSNKNSKIFAKLLKDGFRIIDVDLSETNFALREKCLSSSSLY